ncbi:MAG TPA: TlpA disulfide reductase family protein [Acidobacteriaceae bacterium]|nr:TlpA disulfide reductase family protein [Acidobacteriaceae bacterium]
MRILRSSIVVSTLLAIAALGCNRGGRPEELGKPAPAFSVSDGTSSINLAQYRGKVVLLNFWASWCPPCVEETPSLLQFHHAHPEFPILAVSIDESDSAYKRFLLQHHFDLITVRDPEQTVAKKYAVTGWPETFVIDRQGNIRRHFISAQDWNDPQILRYLKTL